MEEIKVVTGVSDTINIPSGGIDDDIDIRLSTPRRKAPSRRNRKSKSKYTPPQPPTPSIIEDPTMDAFINPSKKQFDDDELSFGGEQSDHYSDDGYYDEGDIRPPPTPQAPIESVQPSKGYDSVDNERVDLLSKFSRLDAKGIKIGKRFSAYSDIHEMRTEYQRLTYSSQLEASIKFQRRVLMAATTGAEFCNTRFNPFDVELDGWSENVMENIDEYDNVFEELFIKYRESVQVAPEIRLLMTLGGSAMMFHFTKTMFKAAMPSMQDVVKQNPDLVKNMVNAVANTTQRSQPAGGDIRRPPSPTLEPGARREMKGPDVDMSNLFSSLMPMMGSQPPPVVDNGVPHIVNQDDDIESLISSVETFDEGDDGVKNVTLEGKKKKRRRKKKDEKIVEI